MTAHSTDRPELATQQASGTMESLVTLLATFLVALLLGLGSAWYAIERGSPLTTLHAGAWSSWIDEGNPNSDVYTRAHLARTGRLPLSPVSGRYFLARADSDGRPLTSACEYEIQGSPLDARWWSLALYGVEGRVIDNPSQRFSFNSSETVRHADGTFRILVARNARPENWLPLGDGPAQELVLLLRLYGVRNAEDADKTLHSRLPVIRRKTCE